MKAIVTRQCAGGWFPEVGTLDRAVIEYRTMRSIRRWADGYAHGRPHRIEFFAGDSILGEPFKVEHVSG